MVLNFMRRFIFLVCLDSILVCFDFLYFEVCDQLSEADHKVHFLNET